MRAKPNGMVTLTPDQGEFQTAGRPLPVPGVQPHSHVLSEQPSPQKYFYGERIVDTLAGLSLGPKIMEGAEQG